VRNYKVNVILYHSFEVEAETEEDAREEANHVMWDDHIKDCVIEVEGVVYNYTVRKLSEAQNEGMIKEVPEAPHKMETNNDAL